MLSPKVDSARDVLEQIFRKASADGLGDEVHDEAVAVRELQVLVDPGLRLGG